MSFGDHIEELRMRLIRAILGFLVAMVIGLFVGKPVLDFIQAPVRSQLLAFYHGRIEELQKDVKNQLADSSTSATGISDYMTEQGKTLTVRIKEPGQESEWKIMDLQILPKQFVSVTAEENQELAPPASLTTLTVMEAFMTYFKVSIYCGIVLASPWILYQLWMFISAGLYPNEKKYVYMYLPLSVGLFLAGVAMTEMVALPLGVRYLLSFNAWLGVEPELRLSEWLNFAILMPLVFGAAFQTPIVMLFLERMGIVEITLYTKNRRMAYFGLAAVGAFLAAAPDALNMMLLVTPLWLLYEMGILLCRLAPNSAIDMVEQDPDEMVVVYVSQPAAPSKGCSPLLGAAGYATPP